MLLAASTQRTIGFVILGIVFIGYVAYLILNSRSARDEVGSEIELAPNRKALPRGRGKLEGTKLDKSLLAGLAMLAIIGVGLPLYWLGEPGRHEGLIKDTDRIFADRGGELYVEGSDCQRCHGAEGTGGSAPYTLTDAEGNFVATVAWTAPALNTVLSRFSEDEVRPCAQLRPQQRDAGVGHPWRRAPHPAADRLPDLLPAAHPDPRVGPSRDRGRRHP